MTIPDNILRRLSPATRKTLGKAGMTSEEAMASFAARSEKELQQQIANLLSLRGIWFCRSRMDKATTQQKGVPDFLFALRGVATAFEVKHGKGKLRPEQEATHAVMEHSGWRVHTVRTLDEARDILNLALQDIHNL